MHFIIQRMLRNIQEKCGDIFEIIIFATMGIDNFDECTQAYRFGLFRVFHFVKFCEGGHQEMKKIPVKNIENIGYGFHIYQKVRNGNLLFFSIFK